MSRLGSLAALGGAALLVVGVLGFVPGVTTHYADLKLGRDSHAQLLGVFRVSILLNVIHVALGAVGVAVARPAVIALASLALWLLGVFAAGAWLSLDTAGNWLHFVLAVAVLGVAAGSAALVSREDLADDLERDLGRSLPAEV